MSAQLTMTPMTPMISMAVCQHPMFCTRSGNGRYEYFSCLQIFFTNIFIGILYLMDEAEFEGVAADLDHVVEEGAEAGQGVGRAE